MAEMFYKKNKYYKKNKEKLIEKLKIQFKF